jgi:hypothetical protein
MRRFARDRLPAVLPEGDGQSAANHGNCQPQTNERIAPILAEAFHDDPLPIARAHKDMPAKRMVSREATHGHHSSGENLTTTAVCLSLGEARETPPEDYEEVTSRC